MSEAYQDRPRRPPMRETVCEIDRDILRLVMRRHNILSRMSASRGRLAPQEEKMIREAWEAQVARVSNDPRLSMAFFSLMQEVSFLPKPGEDSEDRRPAFGLAPSQRAVKVSLDAPLDCRQTQIWMSLAAASGKAVRLTPGTMSDPLVDCVKMFNQMGGSFNREGEGITSAESAPCSTPDTVIHVGDSSLNFYLALGHYLGHPSRAKFTGGSLLELKNIAGVRRFLPELGARLVHIVPKSEGFPLRVECSGILPEQIDFPEDLPAEFITGMLLAAPFYEKPVSFSLGTHPEQEEIRKAILPLFERIGVEVSSESEKIHISPSSPSFPASPELPMDAGLAALFLGLVPALSGSVVLKGHWPQSAPSSALLDIFRQTGLNPAIEDTAIRLESDGTWTLPPDGLTLPEGLPEEWLPLPVAFSCIRALKTGKAHLPAGYVSGGAGWTVTESFVHACGLETDEHGELGLAKPKEPETSETEGGGTNGGTPVWTAPTPFWAAALALAAGARRSAARGFRLSNPGIMTELYPGFWAIYNTLPEPVIRQAEQPEQPKGRRRIRTSAVAQLIPRDEDEE